jgi:predicted dehydrogenase
VTQQQASDRRDFIKIAGATSVAATMSIPSVFAQAGADHKLQVALVGTGGRGTGAAADSINGSKYPIQITALADLYPHRLERSYSTLMQTFASKPDAIDVPPERRFTGFDAYKKAMDTLRPGDIVILTTPCVFHWVHYQYAIEKGLNVFMEKPIVADAPTARRMLDLAKQADAKNLKGAVGLMVRHCRGRQELHQRIADGEIGDLICLRGYRMAAHGGHAPQRKPDGVDELDFQIQNFTAFLWSGGGLHQDYNIHQIDELCWMKNAWPVKAHALGGRHYRDGQVDQNFDIYAIEYTFPDGTPLFFDGRKMPGCKNEFASYVHGARGSAIVSTSAHYPGKVRTFKGHNQTREEMTWAFPQPETSPYELEWTDFINAIVEDQPYNEIPRGVEASVVTMMGRFAAHTGQEVTYEQMLAHNHELAPDVANFQPGSPAPVTPNDDGSYPYPQPGRNPDREY